MSKRKQWDAFENELAEECAHLVCESCNRLLADSDAADHNGTIYCMECYEDHTGKSVCMRQLADGRFFVIDRAMNRLVTADKSHAEKICRKWSRKWKNIDDIADAKEQETFAGIFDDDDDDE